MPLFSVMAKCYWIAKEKTMALQIAADTSLLALPKSFALFVLEMYLALSLKFKLVDWRTVD